VRHIYDNIMTIEMNCMKKQSVMTWHVTCDLYIMINKMTEMYEI